ncbi:hypothetical protein CRUP_035835 [Coryphaenoides rupestris]|nr:hypothetical protein CRUP_035835 [Coryphaenoides rupestris]
MAMPTMRPAMAPMAMLGMNRPEGTCGVRQRSVSSEREDGDDDLKDECQAELPHGRVDPGPSGLVGSLCEGLAAIHLAPSWEDSSGPQSVNSSLMSSLVFCRVYGLGKATTAVMAATRMTSSTGYLPKRVDLRRRHQAMLARMKKAPQRPPNTPSRMKGTSSNRYQGNSTRRLLPNGLMERSTNAATRAAKKERHRVFRGK